MKVCEEITAIDGTVYTVLGYEPPYALLSHDTPRGEQFLVVKHIATDKKGLYKWPIHYRYGPELLRAYEFFEKCAAEKEAEHSP
ncbi:hypothetical protein LJC34_06065 [Oscillospiraceae bacterium OttesenSCG-928-G22]|nr:hypothetical protein [Oscillospiraceae bacterium OttesenSCG-928-G22]